MYRLWESESVPQEDIARTLYDAATAKARAESSHVATWEQMSLYFRQMLLSQAAALLDKYEINHRRWDEP